MAYALLVLESFVLFAGWHIWKSLRNAVVKSRIRNLPGPLRAAWFEGNMKQLHDAQGLPFLQGLAKYGSAVQIHGICGDEQIFISDPRALHSIVIKDQDIFEEANMLIQCHRLTLGYGLLGMLGEHHKRQRKMLNPVFNTKFMRQFTPLFYSITYKLRDKLATKVEPEGSKIDMLAWMSQVALELIGQAGFGYSFEVIDESTRNEYAECFRELIPTVFTLQAYLQFIPFLVKLGPPALRRFIVGLLPSRRIRRLKTIIDTLDHTSKMILKEKRHELESGDANAKKEGRDIISVLLRENEVASEDDRLPEHEILGQLSTFTFAAHDTTSAAVSRILYTLCKHPEAQEKLRIELKEARVHGDLPYDDLMALPYLDAICRETLRLYPPVPFIPRTSKKDTTIALLRPVTGTDGTLITSIPIANNQGLVIGILAANTDPEIWGPDAEEWRPERWLEPLRKSVQDARMPGVYSHTMTFLGGGRGCIGFKFSELEMKIVLSLLLEKFRLDLPDDEEIIWKLGSIQTPSVKGRVGERPYLPMKVTPV
ncbi:cytochrome P450 [Rickenella mellea]|uniref:Cytochrome P450 n=1 Tax=Rickenella mellea TaxID=50990 RepID=A0A4Y7Q5R8_9AGAM|nr:cytochrome P450 [Rickenella mellea]